MRYISGDGKAFNTEQGCCEYEQRIDSERAKREQLEKERRDGLGIIIKRREDLRKKP